MKEESVESVFQELSKTNVNEFIRGKNGYNYLSWAHAVNEMLKKFPKATWEIREWDGIPYLQTGAGCFVEVSVIIDGIIRKQLHPILDYRNKPIKEPDAFQINTSIQRALAKAIALHGMGLYIYQGEDLPPNIIDGLRDELSDLLKKHNLFKENETPALILRMSKEQLEKKVDEYKSKGE